MAIPTPSHERAIDQLNDIIEKFEKWKRQHSKWDHAGAAEGIQRELKELAGSVEMA